MQFVYLVVGVRPLALREKCPITEFFWSVFSRIRTEYGDLRSKFVQMRENTDQKKFRIWTLFTQYRGIKSDHCHEMG